MGASLARSMSDSGRSGGAVLAHAKFARFATFGLDPVGNEGLRALHVLFKVLYRALILSFPTKFDARSPGGYRQAEGAMHLWIT